MRSAAGSDFIAHHLAEHPVRLHGVPARVDHANLATMLATEPVILPTESAVRTGFNRLTAQMGVQPRVIADVDDMAMVRLLARDGVGLVLAPDIVLADELAAGKLVNAPFDLGITERFYAVTTPRRFPHPLVHTVLSG